MFAKLSIKDGGLKLEQICVDCFGKKWIKDGVKYIRCMKCL